MQYDRNTLKSAQGGQTATDAAEVLRSRIASGEVSPGGFLPGVRRLAGELGVSPQTAHRALKQLAAEGLLVAEPSRGYRVLPSANDPTRGCPVAYLLGTSGPLEQLDPAHQALLAQFQQAAATRGWSLLALSAEGRSQGEMLEQLRTSRACGAALDTVNPKVLAMAERAGIPALMVDAYVEDAELDAVLQDNHRGGMLAAKHLVAAGHQRIAWVGPQIRTAHSSERLGGAMAGLALSGMDLPASRRVEIPDTESEADTIERLRVLLSGPDRPTGILALWRTLGGCVYKAAASLGLEPGKNKDFELVSWSAEESYEHTCRDLFGGSKPAMIVWSRREMAQAAVSRLAERRANPELPIMRINVRTRLRFK
jgi:DNA-binding LacI/PurR family transcriptional regulator